MTIGTGIFLSTVLLVLMYAIGQATRHGKWKPIGKIAAVLLAVSLVAAGGIFLWRYISNLPPVPFRVTELAGVKLGMRPAEVTLALGKPDTSSDPTLEGAETKTAYVYSAPSRTIIFYGPDKYDLKVGIACTGEYGAKLLGFDTGSKKSDIIKSLGDPDGLSISRDGLSLYISYKKWNAAFQVSQGAVTEKCISVGGGVRFGEELLSPREQKAADQKTAALAQQQAQQEAAAEALAKQQAQEKAATRDPLASLSAEERAVIRQRTGSSNQALDRTPASLSSNVTDPCAPGLPKAERLRRLAGFGNVRQTGGETYQAGAHSVAFFEPDGSLLACY